MMGAISSGAACRKRSARISNISSRLEVASRRSKKAARSLNFIAGMVDVRSMNRRRLVGCRSLNRRSGLFLEIHDRQEIIVAPLPPRPRIAFHVLVADQLQNEVQPGRADSTCAITDGFLAGDDAGLLQDVADRVGGLDGPVW